LTSWASESLAFSTNILRNTGLSERTNKVGTRSIKSKRELLVIIEAFTISIFVSDNFTIRIKEKTVKVNINVVAIVRAVIICLLECGTILSSRADEGEGILIIDLNGANAATTTLISFSQLALSGNVQNKTGE